MASFNNHGILIEKIRAMTPRNTEISIVDKDRAEITLSMDVCLSVLSALTVQYNSHSKTIREDTKVNDLIDFFMPFTK